MQLSLRLNHFKAKIKGIHKFYFFNFKNSCIEIENPFNSI